MSKNIETMRQWIFFFFTQSFRQGFPNIIILVSGDIFDNTGAKVCDVM